MFKNKLHYTSILLTLLMSIMVSCSKNLTTKKSFNLDFSGMSANTLSGGNFVLAISNGTPKLIKLDATDSAEFESGTWDFHAVSFEGPNPFFGKVFCGSLKNINLVGTQQEVNLDMTEAHCSNAVFANLTNQIHVTYNEQFLLSSPASGPLSGGTNVTIRGKNFNPGTIVKFGGSLCQNITVLDSKTITCTTPPHNNGVVNVEVLNANTSIASWNAYTYKEILSVQTVGPMNLIGMTGTIAVDSNKNVYYADVNGYVVRKIAANGIQSIFAGNGNTGLIDATGVDAGFISAQMITIDSYNNLYVSDHLQIRKITPAGVVTTIGPVYESSGYMKAFTADMYGNVYFIWDDGAGSGNKIQKMSPAGTISLIAGSTSQGHQNGIGAAAMFSGPTGIVINPAGQIFVADTGNFLIRKINVAREVSTFSGNGSIGMQDGSASTSSFSFYGGYAHMGIDSLGNIYVGDMSDYSTLNKNAIRKITPDGSVTTYCGVSNANSFSGECSNVSAYSRFGLTSSLDGTIYYADNGSLWKIIK